VDGPVRLRDLINQPKATSFYAYDAVGNIYFSEGPGKAAEQVTYGTATNYATPFNLQLRDATSLTIC